MPKKKKRHAAAGANKGFVEERGFIVISAETGKRMYLGHPEGIGKSEAERLSNGLAAETRVVPFDHQG